MIGIAEQLPIGTRVRLNSGRVATLISCSFTFARVRFDEGGVDIIAPASELEIVTDTPAEAPSCSVAPALAGSHHEDALGEGSDGGKQRTCVICGGLVEVSQRGTTCSKACTVRLSWRSRKKG